MKFKQYFMDVALRTAELSYARRLKVGAVAVRSRRIIACGYNGTPPGEDNNCEYELDTGELVTKENVRHAEDNLIQFAASNGIDLTGCTLYVTNKPCEKCADKIIAAGFSSVMYLNEYRCNLGAERLKEAEIKLEKM